MAKPLREIADRLFCLPVSIANVYLVGSTGKSWVLVDTGVPGKTRLIREAAESKFGPQAKPECILLTHGHQDHAGNVRELAEHWDVPVYVHALEIPFLTGQSIYPPADPTAPGFLSFLTRFFPTETVDLGARVRPLQAGVMPGLPEWGWHHTPGHSPGHTAFFRSTDATLLAGDAFATMDMDSLWKILAKKQVFSRPPTPSTIDWQAAAESVQKLDHLNPLTFACGHGLPMTGASAAEQFTHFAGNFPIPSHGRYVNRPARADERGIVSLPPAPPDNAPGMVGAAAIATLTGIMFAVAAQRRRKRFEISNAS